jgi:hypothetical protein
MSGRSLSAQVAAAEQRVIERRALLRWRGTALALRARRGLASPVGLLAATGAGMILGSGQGRRALLKAFSLFQLALAAWSAAKA